MIDRTKYPYLFWGWRLALPYNLIAWIYGILLRNDLVLIGIDSIKNSLTYFFTPAMVPILIFEGNSFGDYFWLVIQMISILFISWILVSPIFGMFRLLIGLKN